MRFLIVDDSPVMRRSMIGTLKKIGYDDCVEASNGREGLERLAATPADMVLTDWNMPEMNGLDLVRAIRADPATRTLPILMVTTNALPSDVDDAVWAGADDYVVKPFTTQTIKEKIEEILARYAAR